MACLHYNRDIAKKRAGMEENICIICNEKCLRKLVLKSLDYEQDVVMKPLHL